MLTRRKSLALLALGILLPAGGLVAYQALRFPPDTTPAGAYLRVTYSMARGQPLVVFSYLEDAAQHACFTVRDFRKRERELIQRDYPEALRPAQLADVERFALAPDGSDIWLLYAEERKWLDRLRKDLSGVADVAVEGDRATVVTARGTRYPLRRRENGMWGLTMFTAELVAEAERAARDLAVVKEAAADYRAATAP